MIGYNEYLGGVYKNKQGPVYNFLRAFGCHMYIDSNARYIEEVVPKLDDDPVKLFYNLVDNIYANITASLPIYSKSQILDTIYKTNQQQANYIMSRRGIIEYPSQEKFEYKPYSKHHGQYIYHTNRIKLSIDKTPLKRHLVFYFKNGGSHTDYNFAEKVSVDIFQLCIMCRLIENLINERRLKNFNNFKIVPRNRGIVPAFIQEMFGCVDDVSGSDFHNATCIFANTIHPHGGDMPDWFAGTVPIVCTCTKIQKSFVKQFKSCYLPFFYCPCTIFKNGMLIPNGFDGDQELNLKSGERSFADIYRLKSSAMNNNIYKLINTFIERIYYLDNNMQHMTINNYA